MQTTQIRRTILASAGMAVALVSPAVLAHVGADGAGHSHGTGMLSSLLAGAAHPLTGLDHLAAMVSVGLWSALGLSSQQGQPHRQPNRQTSVRAMLAAPSAFALMLLLGAVLGMGGLSLPGVEPMIAASLLVLGLLVATRMRLPAGGGAALVAAFALFHGLAHGAELGGHAIATLSGMVLSTVALHALGLGLGLALRQQGQQTQRWLPRLAGTGVAAWGLSLLAPAMAAAI